MANKQEATKPVIKLKLAIPNRKRCSWFRCPCFFMEQRWSNPGHLRIIFKKHLRYGQVLSNFLNSLFFTWTLFNLFRRGRKIKETDLPSSNSVVYIDWDKDNEMLAVLQDGMNSVFLWNINTNK
jgi:hypothetical protein